MDIKEHAFPDEVTNLTQVNKKSNSESSGEARRNQIASSVVNRATLYEEENHKGRS